MNRDRFKDAPWIDPNIGLLIGGVGGIGSWLILFLSRIGYNISANDNDRVDSVNLAGQFYNKQQVGMFKIDAIRDNLRLFGDTSNTYLSDRRIQVNTRYVLSENMFSCFDNMESRKFLFESWLSYCEINNKEGIFIDGRLGADFFHAFAVRSSDKESIEKYKLELFDDSEVEDEPCTFKQTTHVAAMLASFMTSLFTNHVSNIKANDDMYEVPFKTIFEVPLMKLR